MKNRRLLFVIMIGLLVISVCAGTAIAALQSGSKPTIADPKEGDVNYVDILPAGRTTPYPEPVNFPELSEKDALDFFMTCSESLGLTSGNTDKANVSVQKMYFMNQGCNAYEIISDRAIMKIRTSDFTVLDLQAKGYYDPATVSQIPMISQQEAQKTAEEDRAKIKASEGSARERVLGIPGLSSEYRPSTTQLIHNGDMDLWQTGFEKVSPTALPGESAGGSMLLRADGLLVNLVVHEIAGCNDTKPQIDEATAISIASEIINSELARLKSMPDSATYQDACLPSSARLGYVSHSPPLTASFLVIYDRVDCLMPLSPEASPRSSPGPGQTAPVLW